MRAARRRVAPDASLTPRAKSRRPRSHAERGRFVFGGIELLGLARPSRSAAAARAARTSRSTARARSARSSGAPAAEDAGEIGVHFLADHAGQDGAHAILHLSAK